MMQPLVRRTVLPASELSRGNTIRTHVGPQGFGNQHTAVGLLIVFHDRHPGASHSQGAAVQSVHELSFVFAFRFVPDVCTSSLIRLEIRTRRYLAEQLLPR